MLANNKLVDEALSIIHEAEKNGIILRLLGGAAVKIHCPEYAHVYNSLGRVIHDIDLIGYGKQKNKIISFMEEQGFKRRPLTLTAAYSYREIFYKDNFVVDIFFDKLQMNHTIDFKDRLEKDFPTIPLAEIFLQKTQIVQLTENDIKDLWVLLLEHDLGNSDNDMINVDRIAKILSEDWGFYYTVTTNLEKIKEIIPHYISMSENERVKVYYRIEKLRETIDSYPKSLSWRLRAKIGTKKKWYKEVERFET